MGSMFGNTTGGHYGYRSAKAAANMMGKSLSVDLKPYNIAVGMIHPGFVATGFDGKSRQNDPLRPGQRRVEDSVQGIVQAIDYVNLDTTGCFVTGNYGAGIKPLSW